MKILGIEKNSFTNKNGEVIDFYRVYIAQSNANCGGLVVYAYNCPKLLLDSALKSIGGTDYKNLINKDCEYNYYFDKDKKTSKLTLLNIVK